MTDIRQNPAMNQFISSNFADAASDGRITGREARELGRFIDKMQGLSEEDKGALKEMVGELEDATNGRFLFFSWKKEISPGDMQGLQNMAQSNQLAGRLLQAFQSAPAQAPQAAQPAARDNSQVQQGGYQQASFDPVAGRQGGGNFFERLFGGGRTQAAQGVNGVARAQGGAAPPWGVGQNGTGLASSGGDCGPASAAMVLRGFGILPENASSAEAIQAVRQAGNAVRNSAPYAMGEDQLYRAIASLSGGRVQNDTSITTDLVRSNASGAYNEIAGSIQESLAAGNMTMLLTGSPFSDSRHYMMISHINENGNFVMVDPAGRGGQANVWEMTPARLQELMREADSRGGSRVMSFAQQ